MDGRRASTGLVLVLALLLPAVPVAAQERDPSPKELWDAYPLEPAAAPPVATPGTDIPDPSPAAALTAPAPDDGTPWVIPVSALALVGALSYVLLRRRRTDPEPAAPPAAPNVERLTIEWRTSPPRPAPPAPPPPVKEGQR